MSKPTDNDTVEQLATKIKQDLMELHGVLLHGNALYRALGFETGNAFRQAKLKGHIPVPLLNLENKRGSYALTEDVARWLAEQRLSVQREEEDTDR